jgi:hypothetical protein
MMCHRLHPPYRAEFNSSQINKKPLSTFSKFHRPPQEPSPNAPALPQTKAQPHINNGAKIQPKSLDLPRQQDKPLYPSISIHRPKPIPKLSSPSSKRRSQKVEKALSEHGYKSVIKEKFSIKQLALPIEVKEPEPFDTPAHITELPMPKMPYLEYLVANAGSCPGQDMHEEWKAVSFPPTSGGY